MTFRKGLLPRAEYEKILTILIKECFKNNKKIDFEGTPDFINFTDFAWICRLLTYYKDLIDYSNPCEGEKCTEVLLTYAKCLFGDCKTRSSNIFKCFVKPVNGKQKSRKYFYMDKTMEKILDRGEGYCEKDGDTDK